MLTSLPELSKAELDILKILWKNGSLSIREVHDKNSTNSWAYSTTKTMMDRMVKKKYLARENFHGVFLYKPLLTKPAGLAKFVRFFAAKVLETDVTTVVNMFTGSTTLTPDEIKELENLVKEINDND